MGPTKPQAGASKRRRQLSRNPVTFVVVDAVKSAVLLSLITVVLLSVFDIGPWYPLSIFAGYISVRVIFLLLLARDP